MSDQSLITVENDFDDIESAMRKNPYPRKPKKPTLPGEHIPEAVRAYADALEGYETLLERHEVAVKNYNDVKVKLTEVWLAKLKNESSLTGNIFDVVYAKAYQDSHSSGYEEVRYKFNELESFTMDIFDAVNTPIIDK